MILSISDQSIAQCGVGYTQAQLNWDNLDFYWNSGGSGPYENYINDTREQTQKFAIGSNFLTIATSSNAVVNPGSGVSAENATHTGDLAGYTGEDVQFNPTTNGQNITITFNNEVANVNFTLYDVDGGARVDFAAQNALSVPQLINMTLQAGTSLTAFLNGTATPYVTSTGSDQGTASNNGSVTVAIAGPVKQITITVTTVGSNPVFWLSDINACVTGSFPSNYNQAPNSQPFTGPAGNQPDYFIVTPDNSSVYMVDPATGNARWLFTDASKSYVNSFGYDPYNHLLYYISENAAVNASNKTLKRYDFSTGTISTLVADISTTLGIPTMNSGVESAGAAYYDGALYMGIEGGKYDPSGSSNDRTRETIIWRIVLDGSLNPVDAYQVFATDAYINASSTSIHDWGDFVIKNGIIYDFNTARNGSDYSQSKYHHYNLMTGNLDALYSNPGTTAWNGQAGMTWTGQLYYFRSAGGTTSVIGTYDESGNCGATTNITLVGGGPAWPGGAGDASENFRPKCDFGDAPSSYDPVPTSPAVHERYDSLRLGLTWDNEWVKTASAGANADGTDEDGIATVPTLDTGNFNYLITIDAYNNSGANATVAAWLDYNGNGVFDAAEGLTATISSSASMQTVNLVWWGINTPLLIGQSTYLRVRITSAAKGMTAANPTGYYDVGEVEDYQVMIGSVLPVSLIYFDAGINTDNAVQLSWKTENEGNTGAYEVERSNDGYHWMNIGSVPARNQGGNQSYLFTDSQPLTGKSFYRLGVTRKEDGSTEKFSAVQSVLFNEKGDFAIMPNPAKKDIAILISSTVVQPVEISMLNMQGMVLKTWQRELKKGTNAIQLNDLDLYPKGNYLLFLKSRVGNQVKQLLLQ
ncbi:MAG: T9SS type A sorting domain-containing protein [Terrimonas sp.]|nr:T9SS type A sorting domain-containing protein [Terrimonas sp.]